jgi:hypothetical protein
MEPSRQEFSDQLLLTYEKTCVHACLLEYLVYFLCIRSRCSPPLALTQRWFLRQATLATSAGSGGGSRCVPKNDKDCRRVWSLLSQEGGDARRSAVDTEARYFIHVARFVEPSTPAFYVWIRNWRLWSGISGCQNGNDLQCHWRVLGH